MMSCEFYKRLAAGSLARVVERRGELFLRAVKLLVGAESPLSSLVEAVELAVDLFKRDFARELAELVKAAKSAGECDEEVKRAAKRLEVSEKWLRTLAKNLAALPEIDLAKLEERARALERGLDLLKRLSPHVLDLTQLFVEEGNRLLVNSPFGVAEYVEVGVEDKVRQALSRGGVAVVYGPRGVGKSTTALKAIYDFARVQPDRAVVVLRVGEDWKEILKIAVQLREGPFVPVLYYDTLEVEEYRRNDEGIEVMYSFMAHDKPLADFLHDAARLKVPCVVVLTEEDYRAYEDVAKRVGAEAVRMDGEAEALVQGILRGVPPAVVDAVLEKYKGEYYAVAAALAKALYEEWRDPARVVEAVKRLDVHSLALAYLWHVVLGGDEVVAEWVAPLILATGFFGPHPPKLAKAVVKAFGGVPVSKVIKWFSQSLYGTLYETMKRVAHGAVYRRFGVGSDELCQGSNEESCRLVEICSEALVGVPRENYSDIEEVAEEYAKLVAKALRAPGPAGVRQIDFLIDDFLRAYNGMAREGRWRIRYETEEPTGVKVAVDLVDELDVLSALYGMAVLPVWDPQLKPLEDWFFVSGRRGKKLYLYPILEERGRELVKRATVIVHEIAKRGFYTTVDLWRAVGIAAAGQWENATDEELEKAVRLTAYALDNFATFSPKILNYIEPLISETWRRVVSGETHEDREKRQRLADELAIVAYNLAQGYPSSLPFFLAVGVDKPNLEVVAKRFDVLYNVASNVGKRLLLDTLIYTLGWDLGGVNFAALLLGKQQSERQRAFEEVVKRVEEFVSQLNDIEKAYAVAHIYPGLALWYTSFGEFDKATKFVEESSKALEELWKAYEKDKASTEKELRSYLEPRLKPDLWEELSELSLYVYHNVALAYMKIHEIDKAVEYAEKACDLAKRLGDVYYRVLSCSLMLKLKAVRGVAPRVEDFEELWRRMSQAVGVLGVETVAAILGKYVVALAWAYRFNDIEKVLEKWGWALELDPVMLALTYGVLSLFDDRYLEKAMRLLPEGVGADLSKFADALYDAVEAGLFPEEPKIAKLTMEKLMYKYSKDMVKALLEVTSDSRKLFLIALVGLAYCKRGEEKELARVAALAGSQLFKGVAGSLFRELAETLKWVSVGNCVTEGVLKTVYKLYYFHI